MLFELSIESLIEKQEKLGAEADLIQHQIEISDLESERGQGRGEMWRLKSTHAMRCKRRKAKHIGTIITQKQLEMKIQNNVLIQT